MNLKRNSFTRSSFHKSFMKEDITRIFRVDKMMSRWMCNVSLKDDRSLKELRNKLGVPDITEMLLRNRLKRFWHVMKWMLEAQQVLAGMSR